MTGKYKITESVGRKWQTIHDYEDIEKHHPTWKESQKRRYGEIDGQREEFVYSPSSERMVSKDFVLSVDGKASVDIPSPVDGYARRSPQMDRWGTVEIFDGPGEDAKLIARIRHMDPIHVKNGDKIEYGQMVGRQSNQSPPGTKVGLHTHMDVSEGHLDQFKQYILDLDAGVITTEGCVKKLNERSVAKNGEILKPVERMPLLSNPAHRDHILFSQALAGIEKLPPNSFTSDQERHNAAASLALEAKTQGLKKIDHVVLNTANTGLFAVQGRIDDPAHHRLYVDKAQAVAQPIEASTQQINRETQQQLQQQSLQPQQTRAPSMAM